MKKNLYIFILAVLFLAVAKGLEVSHFWAKLGLEPPHGFETQGLLFLGVLFVLQNLLFDPYLLMLEERESMTVHKKAQAEKTRVEADAMIANYKKSIHDARIRATLEREKIALSAEAEERTQLAKAKSEASQLVGKAVAQLKTEAVVIRSELQGQIESLAQDIIERVSMTSSSSKGFRTSTPMFAKES